ncbi:MULTISPECIES: hypothetical protein [unclassified Ekhidna]|jgi:hypothetical protein|uniref:hypothetical protein n=1 Tax=unclassified Ekhidna TaxID=2632188 RepID=UPI0032DF6D77
MKHIKNYLLVGLMVTGGLFTSCGDDDAPAAENEEEVIDLVTLTFTPQGGGSAVVAIAEDPDGEGAADFETEVINLDINTTYDLAIKVENSEEGENITEEIEEEDEEHMFFFAFTNNIFSDPAGNGNVDNRTDDVNYGDQDADGNPVGLSTSWTTSGTVSSDGTFQVILKHQPDIKSATSSSSDGETDIDITWTINING